MATAAIAAIGLGVQVVGSVMSFSAQQTMINEQTTASKKAEANREQQMQLDAQRRRRQSIREGIMARSQNLAVATAQGASGSGVQSALGGALGMAQENQQGITSAEVIGGRVFQANRDYFDATQRGQSGMALGQGISALGGALVSNAGTISRLGQQFGSPGPQPQTSMPPPEVVSGRNSFRRPGTRARPPEVVSGRNSFRRPGTRVR